MTTSEIAVALRISVQAVNQHFVKGTLTNVSPSVTKYAMPAEVLEVVQIYAEASDLMERKRMLTFRRTMRKAREMGLA